MTTTQILKRTPFFDLHLHLGGKMVDFAGWEMPVQYTSIKEEHLAVRQAAGLFDISHMGQVLVWGEEAEEFVNFLVTNDVNKLAVGKGLYAHLLKPTGNVIDDLFIYRLEPEKFLLIVNASRKEVDLAWINKQSRSFDVQVMEAPMAAALALQGPQALPILEQLSDRARDLARNEIMEIPVAGVSIWTARTGYTGEDGFEFFGPAGHLLQIWEPLFKAGKPLGLLPAGLGARDTLRTEMAYPLYGHELDENHSPLEAKLSWVVKFSKNDFIGKDALLDEKENGISSFLAGFQGTSGGVIRPGGKIFMKGQEVSTVTSGTFSPSLGVSIGLAFFPAPEVPVGTEISIRQGEREIPASIVDLPFLKKKK